MMIKTHLQGSETTEALIYQGCWLYYIVYNIYTPSDYVHHESRWLKYSRAEDELYSTADGSPPPTYMSPCGLERQ